MSLAVWLPLNGDLHNQGLDPAIFSKTTENVWGSGKTGEKALLTSTGTKKTMVNSLKNKQKFSIAFWVKVDATLNFTNYQDIWALEYTNSTGTGPIRLEHTSTAENCGLIVYKETNVGENTNAYYGIKVVQNKNSWCHITLTKDQDNTKCYINGNLTNTSSNNQYEASLGKLTGNVTIGASTCAAYLNDVRIYDHCLSSKEVEEISKGLILHYPLNQLYDNNIIYDTSGYCNNGTIVGDITTITPSPRYNVAAHLESSSPTTNNDTGLTYIQAAFRLTTPTQMTICWWGHPESGLGGYSNNAAWCTSASSSVPTDYDQTAFHHRDARFDICLNSASSTSLSLTFNNYTLNEWHYYSVTYDGKIAILYKDGIETNRSTISSSEAPLKTFSYLYIGFSKAGGVYRKTLGSYSDFRIYATALSAQQIKELYNTSMQIDSSGNVFARELVEL